MKSSLEDDVFAMNKLRNIKMIKHYTTWMPTNQITIFLKAKTHESKNRTLNDRLE